MSLVSTARFRLPLGPHVAALDALGTRWGVLERRLHARLAMLAKAGVVDKKERNTLKRDFCKDEGVSSRQYNALLVALKGKHAARIDAFGRERDLLASRLSAKRIKIVRLGKKKDAHTKALAGIEARALQGKAPNKAQSKAVLSPVDLMRINTALVRGRVAISRLERRIARLTVEMGRSVPRLVFGGAALARQRHGVDNEGDLASWRARWEMARSGQIFALGSSDETAGNQTCQMDVSTWEKGLVSVRLKAFAPLSGFVEIAGVALNPHARRVLGAYYQAARDEAAWKTSRLARRQAPDAGPVVGVAPRCPKISFRFARSPSPSPRLSEWEMLVTVDEAVPQAARFDQSDAPVLGVDINGDHLAWALVSNDGNPLEFGRVPMALTGKSAGQRAAVMGDAVARFVDLAHSRGARVAAERLDFGRRKMEMASLPSHARRNRALSAFPYGQVQTLLERACARAGVALARVNPAYTSLAGRVKTAPLRGVSVHMGAALAIGRRALGHTEHYKTPYGSDLQSLRFSVKKRGRHWAVWAAVHKALRRHEVDAWLRRSRDELNASHLGGAMRVARTSRGPGKPAGAPPAAVDRSPPSSRNKILDF